MTEPFQACENLKPLLAPDLSVAGEYLGTGWKLRWWSLSDKSINEFLDTVFADIAPGECRKFLSDSGGVAPCLESRR